MQASIEATEVKDMREEREAGFGAWLVEQGYLEPAQLEAVGEARLGGRSLAKALVDQRLLEKPRLMQAISGYSGLPYVRLNLEAVDAEAVKLIPSPLCRKHLAIPVSREEGQLVLAVSFPLEIPASEELSFAGGLDLKPVLADETDIIEAIERFSRGDTLEQKIGEWDDESLRFIDRNREVEVDRAEVDQADIVKLVNLLLVKAIKERASDIHVEPGEDSTLVRVRIDGILREENRFSDDLHAAIISRIKVLSNLDIAERRMPQDGSFFAEYGGKDVDFRVSTSPTIYGESVSIRLLDQGKAAVQLQELGYEEDDLVKIYKALAEPYGFVLSTGPTGSGKTTSMYAMLNRISDMTRKIVTIEDPVEYRLDLVNQIQVNHEIGLGFAKVLRSVLRQDPNIILVGEIRDLETAHTAVQAALTGHLLLSTLHTNNAPETLLRLVEIGIEPFYVREVVKLAIAQRLIRKLCVHCREAYTPDARELAELGQEASGLGLYRARGCEACGGTGYFDRTGIYEVMPMTEELKEMMTTQVPIRQVKETAVRQGMRTLWRNAVAKVLAGTTSSEEIRRCVARDEG
jgi:type IV pilus assembly protein PilB